MQKELQTKVGRPSSKRPYRKNVVRVAAIEDWIEDLIERVPQRSEAKKILIEELELFINQQQAKTKRRVQN